MNASSKVKFIAAALIAAVILSSCLLPSLHPIYTEDTREIDDRIIGTWVDQSRGEAYQNIFSNISELKDASVDFQGDKVLEFDVSLDANGDTIVNIGSNINLNDINAFALVDESIWTFERAVDKVARAVSDSTSVTIQGVTLSLPDGYEIISQVDHPFYFLTHREIEDQDTVTTELLTHLTKIGEDLYLDFVPYKQKSGLFSGNSIRAHSFAKISFENDNLTLQMFDGEFIEELIKNRKLRLRHEIIGEDEEILLTASTKELRSFIEKYGDDPELFNDPQVYAKL